MTQLSTSLVNAFVERTATQLATTFPMWHGATNEAVSRGFVRQVVNVGCELNVLGESSVTRLAELCVAHDVAIPLPRVLYSTLATAGDAEEQRVEAFQRELELRTHKLRVITLTTDITRSGVSASPRIR